MKVRLDVLVSTSVKCKKPWPQIVWLGKEKESLFLLDEKRVSVLYVPSGKTKKNVPKLSGVLSETVCLTPAPDGLYLVGVQSSGEVFVWQKDKDELKTIVGLASLLVDGEITPGDGCKAFPSPDCSQLLLVLGNRHVFLWQKESYTDDSKNNTLLGKWSRVTHSSNIQVPSLDCKEVSMHAAFTYTEAILASWEPIHLKGAYTCQYSHDGQILAVGVNQKSPKQTSVLFISTFTEAMLVSDLKGCGLRDPGSKRGRQYWISDMAWTCDNLFLAVILQNGSAGLLSRLGEPVIIFSKGSSVELGPAYFLTFNPLISVQSDKKPEADEYDLSHSEYDPLHQRFSVTSHPSLPILLYSDGYIVTIAQLPSELNPMIFMRDLVLNSSSHLKQIADAYCMDLTLANAYNLPAGEHENVKMSAHRVKHNKQYGDLHFSFEEPSLSMNETLESEVSFALGAHESGKGLLGAIQNMSSGKIIFGEQDVLMTTEGSFLKEPDSTLKSLQLARMNLFSVWKLAASTTELWSANMDTILNHAVHNIIKLFSIVLDCPQIKDLLDEASAPLASSPVIHTASLFKVVSMYRQLLDLLQFDYQQHHLLAHMLQLSHKTLNTILTSVGLGQCDPRMKTLAGCFTLLRFTEKSMHQAYVSLPKTVQSIALNSTVAYGQEENKFQTKGAESSQLSKRLTATWKLLYKSVTQFIANTEVAATDVRQAQALKSAIEQHLIELDVDIPTAQAASINSGEMLSLDGKHTLAVNAWKEQLKQYQESGSKKNASQLLHSLLYTYILHNDLTAAVAFVDDLIVKANPDIGYDPDSQQKASSQDLKSSVLNVVTSNLRTQAMHDPDMMPCIRNRAVRKVVQSLARFMAAYFSNQTIFIFPPHNPAPLPAVHFESSSANSRIIPKYQADVAAIIRHQKLGSIWTVERTMEYLLLSGLVCEAAWFADRMGNWKAAYRLSVAHILHKQLAPAVYERPKRPLSLPEWLTPDAIMKRKLERLVKDDLTPTKESSDLTRLMVTLRDISLSGIMGFVEIGPWLLEQLVAKLKSVVKQLSPLVAKDFYLPAPPVYLPQLVRTEQKLNSQEANEEVLLREQASSGIQLALCVINATHLSTAALRWYVCALSEAQKKALQFKVSLEGPCVDLPDFLYQYTKAEPEDVVFPHPSDDDSILSVQASFRDLCSLVWLLHARDQLSLALRSREKHLNLRLDVENSEQWLKECFLTLQWAVHMVVFSHFLSDEACIYKVVLSLLLDFPSTEDVANVLAEHMYDLENLHPEVQERLDRLLNSWQGIILTPETQGKSMAEMSYKGKKPGTILDISPRGKSLSVYFHRQCMIMDTVLKKKRQCFGTYEEFVFAEVKNDPGQPRPMLNIGSRPFETAKSFVDFLDTFVSVSFGRISGADNKNVASLPLLKVFSQDVVSKEMTHFVQATSGTVHSRHQGLTVLSGASQSLARASSQESVYLPMPVKQGRVNRSVPGRTSGRNTVNTTREKENHVQSGRPIGLFRGMSMVESPLKRSYTPVRRYESEPFLDDLDGVNQSEAHTSSRNRSEQNLTELASRYWQSDGGGVQEQVNPNWSLTVSFGKKYTVLQKVVEWLEMWGSKSHALGVSEEILEITPQMIIQIPAQLIVLSLWLLEHKYSRSSAEEQGPEKPIRSRRASRLNRSHRSQSPSPSKGELNSLAARHTRTSTINTKPDYLSKQKVSKESQQMSVRGQQNQRVTPAEQNRSATEQVPRLSLPFPTLEQDEIINAYTQLLDGSRDSSSFDLSSLASDELDSELKTTLNVVRRTEKSGSLKENSALNRTLLPMDDSLKRQEATFPKPKDSSTPVKQDLMHSTTVKPANSIAVKQDYRAPGLSLTPSSHLGTQSQTDTKNTSQNKRSSPPIELSSQPQNQDLGKGIANQLQGVIRDELRRIMEVQHRSVLAMMGALDDISPSESLPATSHQTSSTTQRQTRVSSKQNIVSPKRSKRNTETQTSSSQLEERMYKENETGAKFVSTQTQAPFSLTDAHRRQDGRGDHVREALVELQNLQHESNQYSLHNRPQQLHYSEDVSTRTQNMFQNYLGSQGSNLNLPYLPFQAWTDKNIQKPPPFHGFGIARLPLLHINKTQEQEDPFRNLRRFLPQVPPPQLHIPQPTQLLFPPPPPSQPQFSFFTPPLQPQRLPPPPYDQPLLLLKTSANEKVPSGFPFLRLLSPGFPYVSSDAAADKIRQRDKVEETRQKMLKQFHEQVHQDKDNADRQISAHQMLHLEIPEELESARSEKSRTQPESKVDNASVDDQERAETVHEPHRVEVADASTSDTHIHHGFVLPRGIFDSYLQLGEHLIGSEASETSAAFQLRMAQAMQRQVEKRIRDRVDFSTMARDLADEATSVTKDTGVDPIQEVVNEYNLKRHNNLIPPDIFMGLRFGDQDSQNDVEPLAPSCATTRGRSYLNVVDIRASSILRDIPERTEKPESFVDQDRLDTAVLTSERTVQQMGALEETLRQKSAPRPDVTSVPGYDGVTVKLFDQLKASKDSLMSVAVMPRSSVTQPKTAMIRRLQDMTDQMKAIDEMSQNIEREFKSSNLLLKTIQDINDSVQRSRSTSPIRTSMQRSKKELRYFKDEDEEEELSRQSSPDVPALKMSASSPQASARSRSRVGSKSGEGVSKPENELTRLITEVLAQEGADMEAAGFSQEMAEQLEIDARKQIQKSRKMPGSKLRDRLINMKQADEHVKSRTPYEREQLKTWMTHKFHQRQQEYMKRRKELIGREPKPFRSQTVVTKHDLKNLEEKSEKRISMVSEFMNQRLIDAEHLLGSIIVDKPEIPWENVSSTGTRQRNRSRSPGSSVSPPRWGSSRKSRSPCRSKINEATWVYKTASASRSPYGTDISKMSRDTTPVKGILKSSKELRSSSTDMYLGQQVLTSISEGDSTLNSSTDLINYARHVLEKESSDKLSPLASYDKFSETRPELQTAVQVQRTPQSASKTETAKGKSFADLVKMRRPEATRKWTVVNRQRKLLAENEKQVAQQEVLAKFATSQNPNLLKDKAKDYGSKHIPGFTPQETLPRRVKTYSERLQEMKPTQKYSPAARRDPSSVRKLSTTTFQSSVPVGPPHKPQAYTEQPQNLRTKAMPTQRPLQNVQASKKTPLMMRTYLKSHGPKHKPKTYAEQLKELNPHPHKEASPKMIMQSTVTLQGPTSRGQARTRPYNDPYSEVDYEDLASVLSDWDVDENVRNIIYGGLSVSSSTTFMPMNDFEMGMGEGNHHHHHVPSEDQSDYFDAVMHGGVQYRSDARGELGTDDYSSSVDINEIQRIAELASVGSGSVLSVIDWDAVESLVKDV